MTDKLDLHSRFGSGNVVRWDGDLYIVASAGQDKMSLLSFDHSRLICGPSMEWPYLECYDQTSPGFHKPDPTKTVDTVEFVAPSVREFITQSLTAWMK